MQGNMVNAIATQNMAGVVSIGDSITVESVLYDQDTTIVNESWRYPSKLSNTPVKIADAVIAPKGSYKYSIIHNRTTGESYRDTLFGYSPLSSWLKKLD